MPSFTKNLFALGAIMFSAQSLAVQTCEGKSSTAAEDQFTISTSVPGKAYHTISGLEWSRCTVGQTWNEQTSTCDGDGERLTWQAALQLSKSYRLGNHTDWRLPNLKELVSLVERACVGPAIELKVFAAAPSDSYWTSTPNTSADKSDEAWSVGFYNGRIESRDKQQDFYVRMVRYAE